MTRFTRIFAPVLLAGGIAGTALGVAGPAAAEVSVTTTNGDSSMFASPDVNALQDNFGSYYSRVYGSVPPPRFDNAAHG